MSGPSSHEDHLRSAATHGDAPLPIAETALTFAAMDRPRVPLERYRAELRSIAKTVSDSLAGLPAAASAAERAAVLGSVLAGTLGFEGDSATYDDLQNANLMRVLDRRKGLPVALGILYIHAARAQDWQATGLNFPNHFLIRVQMGAERVILDPFNAGQILESSDLRALIKQMTGGEGDLPPGAIEAVSDRQVLLRLQNNIKIRLYRNERFKEGLAVLERMRLLAPDVQDLQREAGMVNARLGNLGAAITLLEGYMTHASGSEHDRHETARLLQDLRRRLN